ncbi:MAG: hypothetical protein AAGK23_00025 [Pseudomonadota bacterium]
MFDALEGPEEAEKVILILEDEPATIEVHENALAAAEIKYDIVNTSDEFLEKLRSGFSENVAGISLDVKLQLPIGIDAPQFNEHAGCWFFSEVLRSNEDAQVELSEDTQKLLKTLPVAFLTNNSNDPKLKALEEQNIGFGFSKFTKSSSQSELFLDWARKAVLNSRLKADFESSLTSASVFLSSLGLTTAQEMKALGVNFVNHDLFKYILTLSDGEPGYSRILSFRPYEETLDPSICMQRWDLISDFIARAMAVFSNNIEVVKADLSQEIQIFGGRSALEILASGSDRDLAELNQYYHERWNK